MFDGQISGGGKVKTPEKIGSSPGESMGEGENQQGQIEIMDQKKSSPGDRKREN